MSDVTVSYIRVYSLVHTLCLVTIGAQINTAAWFNIKLHNSHRRSEARALRYAKPWLVARGQKSSTSGDDGRAETCNRTKSPLRVNLMSKSQATVCERHIRLNVLIFKSI